MKNPSEPQYPEMHILFEEDLSIGVEEGDENYMFGSQVVLNTDDEGHFYVTDRDRTTVKKFDPDGHFLQRIGRPGQGPGEFQDMSGVRFLKEGNIYLNDTKSQRISFLSKDGNYIKGIKAPFLFERVIINSKGFYIARSVDNIELGNSKKWDYFYGLFDDEFNLVAEFLRLPHEANASNNAGSLVEILADSLSKEAFVPTVSCFLAENDSIFLGYPLEYEINVYSPEGKLEKIIRRDFNPVEIIEKHKEYFRKNVSGQFRAKIPENAEKEVFDRIKYPKYKPAYEDFTLMENGWIFVLVDSAAEGSKLVDIFDEDGKYLAQFETDIPTDGLSFYNGKAYAVATIDDYKLIKRYNFEIIGIDDN